MILAETKDGIDIIEGLERRIPDACTIRINAVYIDELLLIHANCGVHVTIAEAPRIFNLVTRPLEANAPELFGHTQVGERVRIGRIVKLCCKKPTCISILEGRADRSCSIKDASTFIINHYVAIGATDCARHGVHVVVEVVNGTLDFTVPEFRVGPVAHAGVIPGF